MDFTITITDAAQLAGICAATFAYNVANAATPDFVSLTDAQYLQFVVENAAASYANQYKGVA